jgi:hypothetical protein
MKAGHILFPSTHGSGFPGRLGPSSEDPLAHFNPSLRSALAAAVVVLAAPALKADAYIGEVINNSSSNVVLQTDPADSTISTLNFMGPNDDHWTLLTKAGGMDSYAAKGSVTIAPGETWQLKLKKGDSKQKFLLRYENQPNAWNSWPGVSFTAKGTSTAIEFNDLKVTLADPQGTTTSVDGTKTYITVTGGSRSRR